MFAIPAPTPYDLKFSLLGIPVRVNPLFWVMAAALGWVTHDRFLILIWVGAVFVSILVHEFGHGLMAERLYHRRPSVTFYLMGGLCSFDGDDRSSWKQAAVLIMGPGAGFLLFGVTLAVGLAVFGFADIWPFGSILIHKPPAWLNGLPEWLRVSILFAYDDLLWINLFWSLFNLLPIYPLDGGRLASVALTAHDRREGSARTFILGILVAGGVAIYFATKEEYINAFFAANLAFLNYQLLQSAHNQRNDY